MDTYFNRNIERIICPFDFTATGRSGLEYASMLAKALRASLTIFYVQPSIWPEEFQLYEDRNDSARGIRRLMHIEAQAIEEFGVKCDYTVEPTTDTMEMAVGEASADYDLIVMGTNGADSLYQHVFGTNTHHVLGLAKCPVLMIPVGYAARIPKHLVYAYDPETNPAFLVSQLENMALPLKAEVSILNVIPASSTRGAERKVELLGNAFDVIEGKKLDWEFEPTFSDDVVAEVDRYMKDENADILALSYHHHTLFEKLFRTNVIKQISRIADYPIMVFWH